MESTIDRVTTKSVMINRVTAVIPIADKQVRQKRVTTKRATAKRLRSRSKRAMLKRPGSNGRHIDSYC